MEINCPICNSKTSFFIAKKDRFGQEYKYVKCPTCRFLFDEDLVLDKSALEAKTSQVYDRDYFNIIDSGWKLRGDKIIKVVNGFINILKILQPGRKISVLDYGGGNGYVTSLIKSNGSVFYYDKYEKPTYQGDFSVAEKPKEANLVLAEELVEHLSDVSEWGSIAKVSENALIVTTEVSNGIEDNELIDWVYLNPDAGHTCIYSFESLRLLAQKYGFFYLFFPYKLSHIFIKSKFLSKVNFITLEYSLYKFIKKIKDIF